MNKSSGQGTERVEAALERLFPGQPLVRIDRDTTRRRGEMERRLESIRSGKSRILLGTQMLTKGHDFPEVTLVGIIDADHGLFGTDFTIPWTAMLWATTISFIVAVLAGSYPANKAAKLDPIESLRYE